jgi:hypothetical protein
VADVARRRLSARLAARSLAGLAQHRRVDLDVTVGAEDDVAEIERRTSASWPRSRRDAVGRPRSPPPKNVSKMSPKPPKPAPPPPKGELSPPMS